MGVLDKFKKNKVFKQELDKNADFQHIFQMQLLFEEMPVKPEVKIIQKALSNKFGDIDIVSGDKVLSSFAVKKFTADFKDASIPAQVLMMEVQPFSAVEIDDFSRSQLWNVENGSELIDSCKYKLTISDMMCSTLEYKHRCELLVGWLQVAASLFPNCTAVWIPSAGKLHTKDQVVNNDVPDNDKFVYLCVNVRLFNIEGTGDMLIDSLGLYAIGLPDVQYHFHGLEPNAVATHAYNVLSYIFDKDAPIKSGETIDGLEEGRISRQVQWKCQYEEALIQPAREVMDVCPGEYASGGRE